MNSCQRNRKEIASLAMNELERSRQSELIAHLDKCAGCRSYYEQMSNVVRKLHTPEPAEDQPSAMFHRNLMHALATEKREPVGEKAWRRIWNNLNWRWAFPATVAAAVVLMAWLIKNPSGSLPMPLSQQVKGFAAPITKPDRQPTFSNYEIAVHQSLDKLDELLTEQGNRNPGPSSAYTAASLPRSNVAD